MKHRELSFCPGMVFSVQFLETGVRGYAIDSRSAARQITYDSAGREMACEWHLIDALRSDEPPMIAVCRKNSSPDAKEIFTVGGTPDRPLYRVRAPVEIFGLWHPCEHDDPIAVSLTQGELLAALGYGIGLGLPVLPNAVRLDARTTYAGVVHARRECN